MFKFKDYDLKHYNVSLLGLVIILGSVGMVLIQRLQDANERQFEKQVLGYILGVSLAIFISLIDYHFICKFYIPLYIINFILLVIVKFSPWGKAHYDAKRWILIPGINQEVQPSELTKIIIILFFAKYFDMMHRQINKLGVLALSFVLIAIPTGLILIQTDLSTSIVLGVTFLAMLFIAGLSYKIILPTIAIAVPAFAALFWYVQQPYQILLNEYQQLRVLAMVHPELYPDLAYQQSNAAKAIVSGGMTGKLLTDGNAPLKSGMVPVIESDFIFTAIAEAFGFVGSVIVILLLALFVYKAIRIAKHARDYQGMMIASGIASLVMFQIFVNIGVVTSILPNTGIPLPFVSSGLSALMGNMIMVGILLNVSLQNDRMIPKKEELSL
ncbi:MAG: FtsW/RodA/SpoVE family cell cycle protein [Clostridiales bacterium]|nr:FtsW/RodA/SpoVE family cell cycle protein [Clostridiales bacterium]